MVWLESATKRARKYRIVLDHEDLAHCVARRALSQGVGTRGSHIDGPREHHAKTRAAAGSFIHLDVATMRCDDFAHDLQAEPCTSAVGLGREKWLKNLLHLIGRDARTRVFDDQRYVRR